MGISDILIKKLNAKEVVSRTEIQEIAKIASDENDILFLHWVTNLGKSRAIMNTCSGNVLMSHSQILHQENFIKDSNKHNIDVSNYTHTIWNSYHKYNNTEWDYIVIDEFDNAFDAHLKFLKTVKYKKLILLSGTIGWQQLVTLKQELNPFIFKVTLKQAVNWKIFENPTVYIKLCELDNSKYTFKVFYTITKTEKEALKYLNERIPITENLLEKKLLGKARKELFEQCKYKEFVKGKYFERLNDKRTIFFFTTNKHCDQYGNSITHKSTKTNQSTVDKFNNGEINYLSAQKILNRAMSVDDINYGVMLGFDFNEKSFKQQGGRILRGSPNWVVFLVKNTKEYDIFMKMIKDYGGNIKYLN